MFSIEIDGIRVLYTGDYSMEEDRHLMCAEVPPGGPPDVLIVESTFGVVTLPAREEREARFTGMCCHCIYHCYHCFYHYHSFDSIVILWLLLKSFTYCFILLLSTLLFALILSIYYLLFIIYYLFIINYLHSTIYCSLFTIYHHLLSLIIYYLLIWLY